MDGSRMISPAKDETVVAAVVVATICVLASDNGLDLLTTMKELSDHQAIIVTINEGLVIRPGSDLDTIVRIVSAYDRSRRDGQTWKGRRDGCAAAASVASRRREHALNVARPLWAMSPHEMSNMDVSQKSGLSVGTLYRHLGTRSGQAAGANEMVDQT